ncbi:hypothetical protein BS47DRAFT_1302834 [Hydnum rufescens UP504]|uniref:Uncharacterized protein n=1 Tax=Hydnum rufescens UP504 TaxID=1448309 RepID=A0A9P6AMA4_9AGAM|nr:hypothetical protein BS47DRAFT_1302834 [Hydnum rufescens UP504]
MEDPSNPSAPWASEEEWAIVEWILSVHILQKAIDQFLKLQWVRKHSEPLTFSTAKEVHEKVQSMPGGPPWKSTEITLKDALNEPQIVFHRDPIECTVHLFQNPKFEGCMDFTPKFVYNTDGTTRMYHEMATADGWHEEQVGDLPVSPLFTMSLLREQAKLPKGTTMLAIIIASDETHLTNFSGDKSMHAVYITLGNIHDNMRRKPMFGAWMLLARLPTSKFANTVFNSSHTKLEAQHMPGVLKEQIFHESLQIILEPLREDR